MFTYKKTVVRKVVKEGNTTVEETVEESTGPEAEEKAKDLLKEEKRISDKLDRFFKKMDEAFKEL